MIRSVFLLAMLCAVTALCVAQEPAKPLASQHPTSSVTAAAVWNPAPDTLAAIRQKCGAADPTHIERCFLNEMKGAGASPEALAFAESLATSLGVVYLRAFRSEGRVDVSGRAQTESIMIRALAPSARPGRFCPVRRSMHVQVDPGGSRTARERA